MIGRARWAMWRPIATAPKDRNFLGWEANAELPCDVVWWDENNSNGPGWSYGDHGFRCNPTHWMEIPKGPEEEDEKRTSTPPSGYAQRGDPPISGPSYGNKGYGNR